MERGFLSQKGSRGRGVKEKNLNRNKTNTTSGIGLCTELDSSMNEDTPIVVASAIKEVVSPSVVYMSVEKEKRSCLEDTTVSGSFPPLSTQGTTTAGNAHGKSSYANVTGKPSGDKLNFCTLITPRGNGIDVVVPVESIHAISERFANTSYGFFLGKHVAYPIVANYVRNTWVWVKLYGVPVTAFSEDGLNAISTKLGTPLMLDSYTSDMCMQSWGRSSYARAMIEFRVDYEWKPPRCASCKVFGHIHEECQKNIGVGETKNLKKPSQTSRGVPVGLKVGFKPHKEYRRVSKKRNASSSGNKKKGVEHTIEVSNSNPFEVLNSVDNDVKLAILMDEAGNPLKKVEFSGDYDSEYEVASVDNDMARSLASERVGFGTQSLLEQWRDSYGNGDYDEDPYDDDMYEGQDLSQEIQAICDNLDIRVRGRKKK
ncbi:retrotransposon protein, putative, ty1-copia subclass [Tanacetum coccineum]